MKNSVTGKITLACIITAMIGIGFNGAVASAAPIDPLTPSKLTVPPVIDGRLNDTAWQEISSLDKDFITFQPKEGDAFPERTHIWMSYDNENLYFAFRCFDNDPELIKTSITKRDNMLGDDWVGVSLDALNNRQTSYVFLVNPSGIQADLAGGNDAAPDWIWDSAAHVTKDGYDVEIRVPLKSINFTSGDEVNMGIMFARRISRDGVQGSWPEMKIGDTMMNAHTPVIFKALKNLKNLEVLPSVTYGGNRSLKNPNTWNGSDSSAEFGGGLKYNVTSSVTVEATVNPDFSHIESDAFQMDVNQRYPIFYSEKRPFFMEGMSLFNVAGTGGNMRTAVHTRKIIDPQWSTKLTGTAGKTNFGILTASDTGVNPFSGSDSSDDRSGRNDHYTIARGKYTLNKDNYIGGIYSGRQHYDGDNHVLGVDSDFGFRTSNRVGVSVLRSMSANSDGEKGLQGTAANLNYIYNTKPLQIRTAVEHYSSDFRMDTAFYRRTGFNTAYIKVRPGFYPEIENAAWLKCVYPYVSTSVLHNFDTRLNDNNLETGIRFVLAKNGYFNIVATRNSESWTGKMFDHSRVGISGGFQPTNWLRFGSYISKGTSLYYDEDDPFVGDNLSYNSSAAFQPNDKFTQSFTYNHSDFSRKSGKRVYTVDIMNTRTTYQFNKYFFVRSSLQYNSYQKKLLQDWLASFTFIPGTVVQLGYGSITQKSEFRGNEWVDRTGHMRTMDQAFFFKTSYLHRF